MFSRKWYFFYGRVQHIDCSNQYWTSELIADFSEDTHKIDCDWSRIKTLFNPTLAPKCTLQLYCSTSPSTFWNWHAILCYQLTKYIAMDTTQTPLLGLFFASHISSFEPPLIFRASSSAMLFLVLSNKY